MRIIKHALWISQLGLSVIWWITDQTQWSALNNYFQWRAVLNQYTGVLAIGVMSLAMILSARPACIERRLDGLDKVYRLHKWLGISALVTSIAHFLLAKGSKWAVGWGWLDKPRRGPRPALEEAQPWLEGLFRSGRGLAESVGEWAFYLAAVLMVIALIKRFPYKRFVQTHRMLALVYLALVFHSVILLRFDDWTGLNGLLMGLLMTGGSVAAVMSLLQKRASGARVTGEVVDVEQLPVVGVLKVDIQLQPGWHGHQAGQFAFVTFDSEEGPHPFTIASAWEHDGKIRFLIKGLGDYTRALPNRLKAGDAVTVEGPFGCFDFEGDSRRQIWIGAGIGISPFIARMRALASQADGRTVDLFHSTRSIDAVALQRLERDAADSGVNLHLLCSDQGQRLDVARLTGLVPEWRSADVWFCGPAGFGHSLKAELERLGLPAGRFHQELFEMR